ncbi:MAG: HAD family phosphatase [Calditrichaeota bacterium]|nr:MAG: HAD family phosphatase [Calditrichota bacterium]
MINNIQAIIFDMDGVFVNTEPLVFTVFRRVFDPLGISLSDEYQYKFIGIPFSRNLQDIRTDWGIDFDDDLIRQTFDRDYEETLENSRLDPQSGILEIITFGRQHHMKFGLCTTSTRHHVQAVFRRIHAGGLPDPYAAFDAIISGDQVRHKKPHPEPYLAIAEKLALPTHQCLVIEDSISGIQSAKSAGCRCVGLRHPYNRHIDFSAADGQVESLWEILPLLEQGAFTESTLPKEV